MKGKIEGGEVEEEDVSDHWIILRARQEAGT
jgi:hypothetical protein